MISQVCCITIIRCQFIWSFRPVGLLNLPKQVFYASLILHQCYSIELYLFFSAQFITMGCWEKSSVRKFFAVRLRQTPLKDGPDIVLIQFQRMEALLPDDRLFVEKSHFPSSLRRPAGACRFVHDIKGRSPWQGGLSRADPAPKQHIAIPRQILYNKYPNVYTYQRHRARGRNDSAWQRTSS